MYNRFSYCGPSGARICDREHEDEVWYRSKVSPQHDKYNNDDQDANVRKTIQSGYDLINQSASLGHGGALYYLALLHLNGERQLGIPSSVDEFVRYLDESCGTGNGDGCFDFVPTTTSGTSVVISCSPFPDWMQHP